MAPPSSSPPSLPPHRSHLFTPIQEGNESEETEERHPFGSATPSATSSGCADSYVHRPTPLHERSKKPSGRARRLENPSPVGEDRTVSCNNCRPTSREKTSVVVVPVDHPHSSSIIPSPNGGLFKTLITGLSRRSPKPAAGEPSSSSTEREEQWRLAVAELSHKLVQATKKRDEAVLEASRLKYSMAELEKKLNRLEVYCHNLKSGLEICGLNKNPNQAPSPVRASPQFSHFRVDNHDLIIKHFLVSVSEARASIRILSRALTSQLKLMGVKVFERLSTILRSYEIKLSSSNNPRSLQFYLEALLSAAFYEDFESSGFSRSSPNRVLNPIERSETNYEAFTALKDLAWEEVLSKGTKHFSEEFSRFCDRKMSEIVAMLGWNRPWPEQLLQAFFGASKTVWLVHLLANSVHPALTIFRVDKMVQFDPVYMEDMGGDKAKRLVPTMVRIMVAPGFYVYDNVVKCKVLCRYYNTTTTTTNGDDNRIPLSPP